MALIGVGKIDDGIPIKRSRSRNEEGAEAARKVINVEASLVDEVNEYAEEELEEKLGFKPTFSQTLKYIINELRQKKK